MFNNPRTNNPELNPYTEPVSESRDTMDNTETGDSDDQSDIGKFLKGALLITASLAAIAATVVFAGVPALIAGVVAAVMTSVTIDQFRNDLDKPILESVFAFGTLASAVPLLFLPHNPVLGLVLSIGTSSLIQASEEYLNDKPFVSWWILVLGCISAILLIKI